MAVSEANKYWEGRQKATYYQVARVLTAGLSKGSKSIIDVGSAGCPYLDWFDHVPTRVSLDRERPYEAQGVASIRSDFLNWEPDQTYDIVTCFQVLEHVRDAELFAQKLLKLGKTVIVSVPYKWKQGRTKSHVQDPVDEEKMRSWFQREPDFEYVCREASTNMERLIHVYEPLGGPWPKTKRLKFALLCRSRAAMSGAIPALWRVFARMPRKTRKLKKMLVGPQNGFRARQLLPLWRVLKNGKRLTMR